MVLSLDFKAVDCFALPQKFCVRAKALPVEFVFSPVDCGQVEPGHHGGFF